MAGTNISECFSREENGVMTYGKSNHRQQYRCGLL